MLMNQTIKRNINGIQLSGPSGSSGLITRLERRDLFTLQHVNGPSPLCAKRWQQLTPLGTSLSHPDHPTYCGEPSRKSSVKSNFKKNLYQIDIVRQFPKDYILFIYNVTLHNNATVAVEHYKTRARRMAPSPKALLRALMAARYNGH
jgi:hypothetical protein